MQILLTFENAAPLLSISDRLQIDCITKVVEQFLISHLNTTRVVDDLLL